jgi:hypothetical protein
VVLDCPATHTQARAPARARARGAPSRPRGHAQHRARGCGTHLRGTRMWAQPTSARARARYFWNILGFSIWRLGAHSALAGRGRPYRVSNLRAPQR